MSGPDWDARYRAAEGSLFGDAPNDYLRMICARTDFAPKTALLPADGDGRNGSWLASQGIAVTAFDLSAEATRRAVDRDKVNGVSVERNAVTEGDTPGNWTASPCASSAGRARSRSASPPACTTGSASA